MVLYHTLLSPRELGRRAGPQSESLEIELKLPIETLDNP
jgi:hypothetical protein